MQNITDNINQIKSMQLRQRVDRTKEIAAEYRRLDTLAKIASGSSTCLAVTIIKEKLYISANEFHNNMQKTNEKVTFASSVVDYFSNTIKNIKPSTEKIANMFEIVCLPQIPKMCGKGVSVMLTEPEQKKIIKDVYDQSNPTISQLEELYGASNYSQAAQIFTKTKSLHKKFLKLGESCQPSSDLKISWNRYKILKNEPNPGGTKSVHAEMQQLSKIINDIKNKKIDLDTGLEIYIGISKLCCLQCRTMIEAANAVLKEKGIDVTIKIRGQHDRDFPTGWTCPQLFQAGYNNVHVGNKDTLEYKIGSLGNKKYKEMLVLHKDQPKGNMSPSQSDSEPDNYLNDILAKNLTFLSDSLSMMKDIKNRFPEVTVQEVQDMYLTADLIGHSEDLKGFLNGLNKWELEETESFFDSFYEQSLAQNYSISKEHLLFILTTPTFLGEAICKHFCILNANINQNIEKEEKNQSEANFLTALSEPNNESGYTASLVRTDISNSTIQNEINFTGLYDQGFAEAVENKQDQLLKRKAEDDDINPNPSKKRDTGSEIKFGMIESDEKFLFSPSKSDSDVINKSRALSSISSTTLIFDTITQDPKKKRLSLSKRRPTPPIVQTKTNTAQTEDKTKNPGM